MSKPCRFYVYRLFDDPLVTLYVGKGSGRRLDTQTKKWRCRGEILQWFKREKDAYAREVELIAELRPTENRHIGGNGSRVTPKPSPRRFAWEIEMERVGTRVYTARALLKFDLSKYLAPEKIQMLRQIASTV